MNWNHYRLVLVTNTRDFEDGRTLELQSDRSMQSLGVEAAELLIERYGTR